MFSNPSVLCVMSLLYACTGEKGELTNASPEVEVTSPLEGTEVLEGYPVLFTATVSDLDHSTEQLTARWLNGSDPLCESTPVLGDGITSCEAILTPEVESITVEVRDPDQATGTDTISITVTPTEAPIATITTPTAVGVYYVDYEVEFSGTVTDAEDDATLLSATWESSIDGLIDVDTSIGNEGSLLGTAFLSEGSHVVTLHVEDATGKADEETVQMVVGPPNSPPLCEIRTPNDGSAGIHTVERTFVGAAEDVDVPEELLNATWSSDIDGELHSALVEPDGAIEWSTSDLSIGNHTITLIVEDEVGGLCTSSISYAVGTPPNISIEEPLEGGVFSEGSSIVFAAMVSDAEDLASDLVLNWSLNGTAYSTQEPDVSGLATFSDETLTFGTHTLVVEVTDPDGLTASDSVEFIVNGLPSAPSIHIEPDPVYTSDVLAVVVDVDSVDPEGGLIGYQYEWSLNGQIQNNHTSDTIPSSETTKGDLWTVSVMPYDAFANGAPAEVSMTISNSEPLFLTPATISSMGTQVGDEWTCSASGFDQDDGVITPDYVWQDSVGTILGTSDTLILTAENSMPTESITCVVTLTDLDGVSVTSMVSETVTNTAPIFDSPVSLSPSTALTSTTLTCDGTVVDPDGDNTSLVYAWANSNGTVYSSTSDTFVLTPGTVAPTETVTCTMSGLDPHGGVVQSDASVVVQNTMPTVAVSLSPTVITTQDAVDCLAVPSDADGQTVTLTYTWLIDGVSSTNQTALFSDTLSVGTDIVCQVVPDDGMNMGSMAEAQSIVQNTPPVITDVSFNTFAPQTNDLLQASPVAVDVDGHSLTYTYQWFVNGAVVYDAGDILDGSLYFDKGDDIYVVVTANDGFENGLAFTSAILTGINSPPEIFEVSVDRSDVEVGGDIECSVDSAIDPDGDAILYSFDWIDSNATAYQQGQSSTDTTDPLLGVPTSGIWTCQVVPTDGIEDGNIASVTVTVYDSCSFDMTDWSTISPELLNIEELLPTIPGGQLTATWDEPLHDLILHPISPSDRNGYLNDSTSCDTPPFWDQDRVVIGPYVNGANPHCRIQLRDSNPNDQGLFAFNRHRWSKNEPITGEPSWLQFRFPVPEDHLAARLRYEVNWSRLFGSEPTQCHPDDQDANGNCTLAALVAGDSWDDAVPAGLFILWGEAGTCGGWTISGPHEPINDIQYSGTTNYTIEVPEEIQDVDELVVTFMVYHQYPGGCEGSNCIAGEDYPYNIAFHGVDLFTEKEFSPSFEPPTVHPRLFGDNDTWMAEMETFETMDCLDSSWPVNSSWGGLTNIHNNWDLITKGGMTCEGDVPMSLYDVGFAEPYLNGTASWEVTQAVKALHLIRRERACQSTGIGTCWFDPQEVDDLAAAIISSEMARLPTIVWNSFNFEFDLRTREPMRVYTLLTDVLWDDLTPQQHQDLLDATGTQIDGFLNHFDETHWAVFNGNNWTPVLAEGALYWAITYYHEDSRAPDVARLALYSLWLHRHSYLDDGVYNEGLLMYSQVSFDPLVQVSRLAEANFGIQIQSPPWERMDDFSNWALAFMGTDGYTIDFGDSWAKKGWKTFMPLLAHMVDPVTGRFDQAPDPCFAYRFFNNKYYFYGITDPWMTPTALAQDWPAILANCPTGNQPLTGMEIDTWEVGGWGSIRIGLPGSTTIGSQTTSGPSLYAQHDQVMLSTSAIPNSTSHTELDFATMVWIAYGNRLLVDFGYGSIGNDRYESYPDYQTFDNNPMGHNTLVIPEAYNGTDLSTNTSQIDGEVGTISQFTLDGHTLISMDGSAVYGRDNLDLGWMEHFERMYLPFDDGVIFVIDSMQARADRGLISPEEYWLTYTGSSAAGTCSNTQSGMQKIYNTDTVTLLPTCSRISKYDFAESAGRIVGTGLEGGSFVEMSDITLINRLNQVDTKSQFKWTPDQPQDSDVRIFALLSATSESALPVGVWQWSTCGNQDCATLSLDSTDYATLYFDNANGQYILSAIDKW